eukprot:GHVS01102571.1.p1 GENE.GHVS01102571.1~~GHVS01102571.1.p1  ORF type:complete len:322 (+),score=42.54 GHVS01102571.1:56-1021(+)
MRGKRSLSRQPKTSLEGLNVSIEYQTKTAQECLGIRLNCIANCCTTAQPPTPCLVAVINSGDLVAGCIFRSACAFSAYQGGLLIGRRNLDSRSLVGIHRYWPIFSLQSPNLTAQGMPADVTECFWAMCRSYGIFPVFCPQSQQSQPAQSQPAQSQRWAVWVQKEAPTRVEWLVEDVFKMAKQENLVVCVVLEGHATEGLLDELRRNVCLSATTAPSPQLLLPWGAWKGLSNDYLNGQPFTSARDPFKALFDPWYARREHSMSGGATNHVGSRRLLYSVAVSPVSSVLPCVSFASIMLWHIQKHIDAIVPPPLIPVHTTLEM